MKTNLVNKLITLIQNLFWPRERRVPAKAAAWKFTRHLMLKCPLTKIHNIRGFINSYNSISWAGSQKKSQRFWSKLYVSNRSSRVHQVCSPNPVSHSTFTRPWTFTNCNATERTGGKSLCPESTYWMLRNFDHGYKGRGDVHLSQICISNKMGFQMWLS